MRAVLDAYVGSNKTTRCNERVWAVPPCRRIFYSTLWPTSSASDTAFCHPLQTEFSLKQSIKTNYMCGGLQSGTGMIFVILAGCVHRYKAFGVVCVAVFRRRSEILCYLGKILNVPHSQECSHSATMRALLDAYVGSNKATCSTERVWTGFKHVPRVFGALTCSFPPTFLLNQRFWLVSGQGSRWKTRHYFHVHFMKFNYFWYTPSYKSAVHFRPTLQGAKRLSARFQVVSRT